MSANDDQFEKTVTAHGSCAPSASSENPLPDYLVGIYDGWGRWEDYKVGTYRKRPCMVLTKLNHKIGPCWPNAGKFVAYDNSRQVPEREVVAVCYAVVAEDSQNGADEPHRPGE